MGRRVHSRSFTWIPRYSLCVLAAISCSKSGDAASGPGERGPLAELSLVTVEISTAEIEVGRTAYAKASGRDQYHMPYPVPLYTFTSSAPELASVDVSGSIRALLPGRVSITATAAGQSGSRSINIVPASVDHVRVTPNSVVLDSGQSVQLTAVTTDYRSGILEGRPVLWTSSNPAFATVSSTGLVIALVTGQAVKISATSGERVGSAVIGMTGTANPGATLIINIAAPSQGMLVRDSVAVYANVRSDQPLARIVTQVDGDTVAMVQKVVGALDAGLIWYGRVDLSRTRSNKYYAVVIATDVLGVSSADSVLFELNPQALGGGGQGPPRMKLTAPTAPTQQPRGDPESKP